MMRRVMALTDGGYSTVRPGKIYREVPHRNASETRVYIADDDKEAALLLTDEFLIVNFKNLWKIIVFKIRKALGLDKKKKK